MSKDKDVAVIDEMLSHLKVDFVDYDSSSEVAKFYANRSVFITGSTGFIGKVLVEKLVRSCRDIKRIYLLIREKRGNNIKDRLKEFTESCVFDRIKSQQNGSKLLNDKLRAIKGDITLPKFGVAQADMERLSEEVSIVFHGAATVRFVEPIDSAVRNNIYSVAQLIHFCDSLQHLQALIHLSTAYSTCNRKDMIKEIFYAPPMRGEQIFKAIQLLKDLTEAINREQEKVEGEEFRFYPELSPDDNSLLESFTETALRRSNRPNTYTFTKAIAENYLLELIQARPDRYLNDKIQVAIVRPSIVGCALREPFTAFVDNLNAATGGITCLYTGAVKAFPGQGSNVADIVPVDMVTNAMLCIGRYIAIQKGIDQSMEESYCRTDQGVYIFNFVSGNRNPLTWQKLYDATCQLHYKYPTAMLMRLQRPVFLRPKTILYKVYNYFYQYLYYKALDFILGTVLKRQLSPSSSPLVIYERMKNLTQTLAQFTDNQWRFSDTNVLTLYKLLPKVDQNLFQFDVERINWKSYCYNYVIGTRIYALKDDANTLPKALRSMRKTQIFTQLSWMLVLLFFCYFLFYR